MLHCLDTYLTRMSVFTDAALCHCLACCSAMASWFNLEVPKQNVTGWSYLLTAKLVADDTSLLQEQP